MFRKEKGYIKTEEKHKGNSGRCLGAHQKVVIRGTWVLSEEVLISRIHCAVQLFSSLYTAKAN